eukprot:4400744-Pleurochrysis_carterae.AAC.1
MQALANLHILAVPPFLSERVRREPSLYDVPRAGILPRMNSVTAAALFDGSTWDVEMNLNLLPTGAFEDCHAQPVWNNNEASEI